MFGDIGTSPLYALRECLHHSHGVSTSHANVYGIVSLVFWALTIVISLKYVAYVLRADNAGEGGVLALTALATSSKGMRPSANQLALAVGLFGASLQLITDGWSILGNGATDARPWSASALFFRIFCSNAALQAAANI